MSQAIQVAPVTITLPHGQMATTITVSNEGNQPSTVQIRPFAWTQSGLLDDLRATDDLAVSPPLAVIPPGKKQVIRVLLRRPAQLHETSFRLLLDQLPLPQADGTVTVVFRLSIPVFGSIADESFADIAWRIDTTGDGTTDLVGVNSGGVHERVRDIRLITEGGRQMKVRANQNPYVLAGTERRWRIEPGARSLSELSHLRLQAELDSGPIDQTIEVHAAP